MSYSLYSANNSAGQNVDRLGKLMITLKNALVASGRWRIHGWGDGSSSFSTTLDADFAGLGYTTNAVANGIFNLANSFTGTNAWFRLREYVNGSFTGREWQFQRASTATAGNEKNIVAAISHTGFTGTPNSTTPYTGGTTRFLMGTAWNSAGINFFSTIATAPNNTAANTIYWHIWTSTSGQGASGDICSFMLACYDHTNSDRGAAIVYEALRDAPGDPHPFIATVDTWANVYGGDTLYTSAQTFFGTSGSVWKYRSGTGNAWTSCNGVRLIGPDGVTRPPGTSNVVATNEDTNRDPIFPVVMSYRAVGGGTQMAFCGTCENLELNFPTSGAVYPFTFFADTAHAEPARVVLGQMVAPWTVGVTPGWLGGNTNYNGMLRYLPFGTSDAVAPAFGSFSPAAGAISYNQAISVSVTDTSGVASLTVTADYSAPNRHEVIYNGSVDDLYDSGSSVSAITDGYATVSLRDGGWLGPFTLRLRAVDGAGNVQTASAAYTISTNPNPAAPDTTAPTIGNISPPSGTALSDDGTAIEFDVTDVGGLGYFAVYARYLDRRDYDVVWDGSDFGAKYAGSTATPISNGYHFSVVRDVARVGGWTTQGRVRFKAVAIDTAGNEAA